MRLDFAVEQLEQPEAMPSARAYVNDFGTVQHLELEARIGKRLLLISLSSEPEMGMRFGRRGGEPLTGRALLTWERSFRKLWDGWLMLSDAQALKWVQDFPAFARGRTSVTPAEALEWALRMPVKGSRVSRDSRVACSSRS